MEWLTTGEMIDKLKVGEEAECVKHFMKSEIGRTVKKLEDGSIKGESHCRELKPLTLNVGAMNAMWTILPNYVSFEDAMKALKEGKKVKVIYPNGEHDHIYGKQSGVLLTGTIWDELFEGKWTIEGENE